MASKIHNFLLCISLLLPLLAHSHPDRPPSPFEFLKHIQGCHKGENLKGVHNLKQYLNKFGYLNHYSEDDHFGDFLENAIRKYQLNYHLNTTGVLDAQTVSKMMTPRCGVPDIINGTSTMRAGKKKKQNSFRTVAHYSFFTGFPRWPATKTHLSFGFDENTHPDAIPPIVSAFNTWAASTHFTFEQSLDFVNADLKIGFHSGIHGDGNPFDGPGGTLAHAFAPTNGNLHYDADEMWSIGSLPDYYDLETVGLHEIGHLLGLGHSSVEDAIMYPTILAGDVKGLGVDDILGIRALYNV